MQRTDRLIRDQQAATPPTPLQRWAHQLLHGTGATRPGRASPAAGGAPRTPLRPHTVTVSHQEVSPMPTTERTTPYEVITNRILALLEQGTVPWYRPWDSAMGLPRNLFSQRAYRGINVWLLTAMEYASPFWATFYQVKAAGGSVRKGEHGVPVVFWKVYLRRDS